MLVRYAEAKDSIFSISNFSLNGLLKSAFFSASARADLTASLSLACRTLVTFYALLARCVIRKNYLQTQFLLLCLALFYCELQSIRQRVQ